MNFRTTYLLFGAVAVLLLGFLLYLAFAPSGDADSYLLRTFHEGVVKPDKLAEIKKTIDRFEIERIQPKGDTLVFARGAGGWRLEQPYDAEVDGNAIDRIISDLVEARLNKKADIAPKPSAMGLENPSATVTLRKGKDTYRISLGNYTSGANGVVFALVSDRNKLECLAVSRRDLEGLFRPNPGDVTTAGEALKGVMDFRPRHLMADGSPVPWDIVQRVTIIAGGKELSLQRESEGNWRFLKPDAYGAADAEGEPRGPAAENIAGVKPLLTALSVFRVPDSADDLIEAVSDFSTYGLEPGKETFFVEFGRKDGSTDLLRFGKNVDEKGEKIYARRNAERFVVKLPAKSLEPIRKLLANPTVLRDRNLIQLANANVDAIDIKLRGEKRLELRRVGTPPAWKLFEEGSDGHDSANALAVSQLLDRLTDRRIIREFPDSAPGDKAFGLDDPAVEISIWQDGIIPEKKDEAKKDGEKKDEKKEPAIKRPTLKGEPTARLKFGKKDKDLVFVRRQIGAVSSLVAIPDTLLALANRPAVDYMDVALPSFDPKLVTKVILRRDKDRFEMVKEKDAPIWKLAQPADLAGRTAIGFLVDQAIFDLSAFQPAKVVTRKANDAELEKYGLKNAKTEITLEAKESATPFVYQFGNETEDKNHYFVKVGGSERVMHANKVFVDFLFYGDVEDRTVCRVDPERVKSLKLTGWQAKSGKPVTLEFTRKAPNDWSVKEPADYKVDGVKVEEFVAQQLYLIRGEKMLAQKGTPPPDQQLEVQAGALTVAITVDGEKEPVTLTLGALEKNGKLYYASSSKAPGVVFLVFKEKFEKVRGGSDFFQKK